MSANFAHDAWWTWGWPSPEAYAAAGNPAESFAGRRRFIDVGDDTAYVTSLGILFRPHPRLGLNAEVRRMDLTAKAHAYGTMNGISERGQSGEFPLSHNAYSLGLSWLF